MQNIGIRYYRPDEAGFQWNGFNQSPSLVQKLPPNFYKNLIPRQNVIITGFPCNNLVASTPKTGACVVDSSMASSALERNRNLNYLTNGYIFNGGEPGVRESYYFTPTLKPLTNNEESPNGRYSSEVSQIHDRDFVKTTYPLPSNPRQESGMATLNSIERNILKMREALDNEHIRREYDDPAYWLEQERMITDKPFASYPSICERKPRRSKSLVSRTHGSNKRLKEHSFDYEDESSEYEEYHESNTSHDKHDKSSLHRFSEEQLFRLEKRKKKLTLELERSLDKIKRDLSRSSNRSLRKRVSDDSLDINRKCKVKAITCPTSYDENFYGADDETNKKNNMRKQTDVEYAEKSYRTLNKRNKRRTALKRLNAIKRDMAVECLAVLLATPEEMDLMTSEDDLDDDDDSWADFDNLSKLPKERIDNISEPVYHTESTNSNELSNDINYSYENETQGRTHNTGTHNRPYDRENMYYDNLDKLDDEHKCQPGNISQPIGYQKEYQNISPQVVRNDFVELYNNNNRSVPEEQLCTGPSYPLAE